MVVFLGPNREVPLRLCRDRPGALWDKDKTTFDFKVKLSAVTLSMGHGFVMTFFQKAKKAGRWSLCTDMGFLGHFDGSYGIKEKISK